MDLNQKIRTLPIDPGVYLYKNAEGEVIYVGKAKNLRARVRSYFLDGAAENAKTGSLLREAVDIEYIVVANEGEALALENNLIKQKKPRYNILLRDDKSYPYVKLTAGERFPRVYVTRRLRHDGSIYYGPYFPANLAYRIVDIIHRHFMIPSCKVDLTRDHARPCLQYYIKRCLGPCVAGLTTPEAYAEAVNDVRMFLEGRQSDLSRSLRERMQSAAGSSSSNWPPSIETSFPPSSNYRRSSAWRPPKATTPTCSTSTLKITCLPSTSSTCGAARCSTAASFLGRPWQSGGGNGFRSRGVFQHSAEATLRRSAVRATFYLCSRRL